MTGFQRHIKASFALLLLTGLVGGCATTPPWAAHVPEEIPAQVCGGDADSDGDGVNECNDRCPGTVRGEAVDSEGCPIPVMQPKPYRG